MKHIIKIIAIGFLLLAGCNKSNTSDNWKTFEAIDYSIQYPDNWSLDKSGRLGTEFFLFSELSSSSDKFKENINLIIQNIAGPDAILENYVAKSEKQIREMGSLQSSETINANGLTYQKLIYTSGQGNFKLKFEQYYIVEFSKAYILTLTTKEDEFDHYQEVGEKIMNSFKLK
jgi:hypothetical protein